ncbi:50S ribosomal protein L11 methyltransferase [Salinimicrobium sediminilitoris]|uniref:50S ribosomal protein L11 methyltransferase n=1 Tax=Salinimicrobium sediminilitoris TaxID=2876715 RepID=UPI001E4893D7|nr:50S ribosomal protein L11 methyltransferase [Salinimicrobium sediminilitoris]MCC8360764.1 50S ribosomal protein L11 methyltransferase [Salinimicrobium sediminilitoris]
MENMNYLEFKFLIEPPQPASEILIAELGMMGFESFVENEDGITAYIPKEEYDAESMTGIHILQSNEFDISFTQTEIEQVNWNVEWEKNFHPIVVNEQCGVRAPFHPKPDVTYDIVIEPKMSFGTGHHATTHMMIEFLLEQDLQGKKVLDMGCGTGVLAIVAEKRGASQLDAIDIDNWCYQNTQENVERNECIKIEAFEGGAELLQDRHYDVIIANINRNILLEDMPSYNRSLNPGGEMYLSGFYSGDIPVIKAECEKYGLEYEDSKEREEWVALKFNKKKD